jgi:hypothetical protein
MKLLTLLSILIALALPNDSSAQAGAVPNTGAAGRQAPAEDMMTRDTLSQSDLKRLAERIDQWTRVEQNGSLSPRLAKSRATAMLGVLKVSCEVSEAAYRGTAPQDAEQHVYEAACKDGFGYLLMLQGSLLTGISCFASGQDESRVACALPANSDSKVMASTVLARNHVQCQVQDLKWLGTSAANLDHIEVACEGGDGFVMRSPPPGSSGKLEVLGCQDAKLQGVVCELSLHAQSARAAVGDSRPTLTWFKEELSRNGVECQSRRARIVGRESIKRRYLVEFECADRPDGLVVFVPPAGDTVNPFESMNCRSAAERGIRCELLSDENAAFATPR